MSKRTELWYRAELKRQVKEMTDTIERALEKPNGSFFMDDFRGFLAVGVKTLLKALERFESKDHSADDEKIAQGFVNRGNTQNQQEVSKNLKNQTGIDLSAYLGNSPRIAEKVNAMTTANVQLIKSIRSQYLDKVQNAVTQAMVNGTLNKDLVQQIKDIGKTTEKRAIFIARDQSSKLNAALTQARHEDVGITKYTWSTSGDERVRESHAEKDGQVFEYANPPADTGHPGHDYNCFTGKSKIHGLPFPEKLYRRWYRGEFTELITDNGVRLLATSNHPVLTSSGIKPIGSVNVGEYLACEVNQCFSTVDLDCYNYVPTFKQVFDSLLLNGVTCSVSTSERGYFHGDVSDGEINVISINSFLIDVINSLLIEKLPKLGFTNSDMVFCKALFSTESHLDFLNGSSGSSFSSGMSRFKLICSLLISHLTPLELFCLGLCSDVCVIGHEISSDDISGNIEMFSNKVLAFSAIVHGDNFIRWQQDRITSLVSTDLGYRYSDSFESLSKSLLATFESSADLGDAKSIGIELNRIIDKRITKSSCHVYNLQTISGYYNINSAFVSNCRCVAIPYLGDVLKSK